MINCVLRTAKFPDIFKVTRIIPVSKPGKPVDQIDSFRPINNLSSLEKLLEQWIKGCFVDWMEGAGLINENHHGGRQAYSTLTAMSKIQQQINSNIQNKNYNILLTTDLSAAFDTIDHVTLLRKMDHYGVRGHELALFTSYLSNRAQFVEIETFRSIIMPCLNQSSIQGSKLAGTLYTLYTNEGPLVHRVFNCPKLLHCLLKQDPRQDSVLYFNKLEPIPDMRSDANKSLIKCIVNTNKIYNTHDPQSSWKPIMITILTKFINRHAPVDREKSINITQPRSSVSPEVASRRGGPPNKFKAPVMHDENSECIMCKNLQLKMDKNMISDLNHYKDLSHHVNNFVDDSSSNIGTKILTDIPLYIKDYLEILKHFYTINLLSMNKQKTKFTIIGSPTQVSQTKNLKINLGQDTINCDSQIRILGSLISSDNKLTSNINELISNLNFRLFNLTKIKKYTNYKSRLSYVNSFVIGKLNYMLPLLLSAPKDLVHKVHLIYMKAAKVILNFNTFKQSNKFILQSCKWPSLVSLIQFASLNFIHKIIYNRSPETISDLFAYPSRVVKDIVPVEVMSCRETRNYFLYKTLKIYNTLGSEIKILSPYKFKIKLRKVLGYEGIQT